MCVKKLDPALLQCNKALKEMMKCATILCENVNRAHAATIIATNLQNGVPFHGHKPGDVGSIRQLPYRQLSAVYVRPDRTQTLLHMRKLL